MKEKIEEMNKNIMMNNNYVKNLEIYKNINQKNIYQQIKVIYLVENQEKKKYIKNKEFMLIKEKKYNNTNKKNNYEYKNYKK